MANFYEMEKKNAMGIYNEVDEEYTPVDMDTTPNNDVSNNKIVIQINNYNNCMHTECDHYVCQPDCPYNLRAKL